MNAVVKITSNNSPSGCHAFPKGSDISVRLSVYGLKCEHAWFYIGNDERVLKEEYIGYSNRENGFEAEYLFNTREICKTDGLFFCHFEFVSGGKRYYTAFDGYNCHLSDKFVNETQILVYDERYATPEWLVGGNVYQIFPDRFARGGNVTKREDAVYDEEWDNGIPEYPEITYDAFPNNKHFGGTLYGVAERLDYLQRLGINCIYLNPIFEAFSCHKYDTADFMSVDKTFGGDEALQYLIDKAHERGMKIVLDGVFNHVGNDSVYFDAYGKYGNGACQSKDSPYYDWFTFRNYPNEYECWWGITNLPRIVRGESYIRFITESVVPKYMKMGIDGWRLDVVDELEGEVLDRIVASIKKYKPDAVIIGEVWEDASNKIAYDERKRYFRGTQLDSVTDYPIRNAIIDFVKWGDSAGFVNTLQTLYRHYPPKKLACLMNYLGSHDTERITTVLGGEMDMGEPNAVLAVKRMDKETREMAKELLKNAYLLLASLPGVPCLFYGDEIAMEGYRDPFNRRPFPVCGFEDEYAHFFMKVNNLRLNDELFKSEEMRVWEEESGVVRIVRKGIGNELHIIANMSDDEKTVRINKIGLDLMTDEQYNGSVTLSAKTVKVIKI